MKIVLGSWFSLPRLGKETFSLLMRSNLRYDAKMGFMVDSQTDIESAVRTISSELGEGVELALKCFVCGAEACVGCPYASSCDRSVVSGYCLCENHTGAYGEYGRALVQRLNA